jgi:hypothetical protein
MDATLQRVRTGVSGHRNLLVERTSGPDNVVGQQ